MQVSYAMNGRKARGCWLSAQGWSHVSWLAILFILVPCSELSFGQGDTCESDVINANAVEERTKPEESKISIKDFAWIAGRWRCESLGGLCEETWSPPLGNSMLGMFRLVKNDSMSFCEILTIQPKDKKGDSFILRLKHFDGQLKGWEKKETTVDFPLVRVNEREAVFKGLSFEKVSENEMHVVVAGKSGNKADSLKFEFRKSELVANDRLKKMPTKSKK